jgi:hypothetical protein
VSFFNPTPAERATELRADFLLALQLSDEGALRKLLHRTIQDFKRLDLPLGCPIPGYDTKDIIETLEAWAAFPSTTSATLAYDAAEMGA